MRYNILSEDDKNDLKNAYIQYHSPYNDGWTKEYYKEEIRRIWDKYLIDWLQHYVTTKFSTVCIIFCGKVFKKVLKMVL